MKLSRVKIQNFQSIRNTEFSVEDITCLVGKNESGKTAILKAINKFNEDQEFDVTNDYPRRHMTEYKRRTAESNQHDEVVILTFDLEKSDIEKIRGIFGENSINTDTQLTVTKYYSNKRTFHLTGINESNAVMHICKELSFDNNSLKNNRLSELINLDAKVLNSDQNEKLNRIRELYRSNFSCTLYDLLLPGIPEFLYFDEYYQFSGRDNLEALKQRKDEDALENSDLPLIGLINISGINIEEMINPQSTTDFVAELEGAANELTDKILPYWSQNRHVRMKFNILPGAPNDPEGMQEGKNIWGSIEDTRHRVTTGLDTRSRGFIWFFSFVAWYSLVREEKKNQILLLDEPGLSLHGKAQEDLVRYFEKELSRNHQLIYSTHSPFMVDPKRFGSVRIVQDKGIDQDNIPVEEDGTKVISEILEATEDSLFPLQNALGYEIHQTLFIGPYCLIVEGVSDLLYLNVISEYLSANGRTALNKKWTICPVGGGTRVASFISLLRFQSGIRLAILLDKSPENDQEVNRIVKSKLLKKNHILTWGAYCDKDHADIEDVFDDDFYLKIFNSEFDTNIGESDLAEGPSRIIERINRYRNNTLNEKSELNHYRPARYLSENPELCTSISDMALSRFECAFDYLNKIIE